MSQYLLLRDNKQSGPYNFEELTSKGLKAYDLIWIEGKSAAWRYPSEIQELKPFAPVVEEQPYDRFYKRQDSTRKQQEPSQTASQVANNTSFPARNNINTNSKNSIPANNSAEQASVKKPSSNPQHTRRVVVIMPGGTNREPQRESVFFHENVENKIAQPEKKTNTSDTATTQPDSRSNSSKEQPATKASLPLEPVYDAQLVDFKRKSPVTGRRGNRVKSLFPRIVAGTLVMLTIGGLIGWAYNYHENEQLTAVPLATPVETVQSPETHTVFNNESTDALDNQVITAETQLSEAEILAAQQQAAVDSLIVNSAANEMLIKKPVAKTKKSGNSSSELLKQPVNEPATEVVQQTAVETSASISDNDEAEKKTARKNIAEQIKVSKNEFKIGAFGGISNLELKVTNNSPYPVDMVVIEVKYLLANKKEFKTENVYFKNLAPGSTSTKEAPKSTRGIQVNSKVALITSKALGMYQASL